MTSFDSSPTLTAWRALLALAVVFVMLAITGWTAIHHQRDDGNVSLKEAFTTWQHSRFDGRELPDATGRPQEVARFFAGLTPERQNALAKKYPLVVGNLNGAPLPLRLSANRTALATARDTEARRMHDERVSRAGKADADRRMHRFAALLRDKRQVLAFDPDGGGRVAEVFGDLERAERISVVVPGVDTNVVNFERTFLRYSSPVGMATSLYDEERKADPGTKVAVIAWADYTAPAGLGMDAMVGGPAQAGARRLVALTGVLPGSAPVALFCHSYGSVVCGLAARKLPERVTDIAVSGSPGMRADTADDLGAKARVWAMRDADDWIGNVPHLEVGGLGHGSDPVSPEFGARVLSAEKAVGHTGYFVPGTDSIGNFARIGVGAYSELSCADGGATCRDGIASGSPQGSAAPGEEV
ncbi:alpha/beta hydrolase family protein [Streptomyces sp. NBC_00237]|uniref:alpha/beta hydrolase n=1 Tax=Streptomyces sp. NBC_00237 TaxID=2975687 RepID=UPI0022591AA4|nr:alpha/beta hydrolase [Streptomyces sp. NBC_00237]MCX5201419.1 alpha/beta hydrolase family protein [Streptomyces sp. NBC_00237]